ncbi:MAG: glycoside hydrolase family 25 protein [Hyphomicrobiaceae bacterium]|nr:glycoside hydrolase family 25 protein [Hyphomicrobiaceae bacterium]MCC0024056.1 glycoside hydrolase family 25 protein [Hyphomicrobiaceae bacterium]
MPVPVRTLVRSVVKSVLAIGLVSAQAGCFSAGIIRGDNDPHPGVFRAHNLPIQGIDVARYQGDIDFNAARAAGTHFVFIKATEGGDYVDPMFRANWQRARNAGVAPGAYHFMTWCRDADEQADWFVANVPNDPFSLPPVLDLEWNNHSQSCRTHPDPDTAFEMVQTMLARMEAHSGKLPIIYTDMTFHKDVLAGRNLPNTMWLRSVAAEPHLRYRNEPWTFWQYTQTGVMPGIRGEVDRNAFYGSEEEWVHFILTGCDPRDLPVLGPTGRCASLK